MSDTFKVAGKTLHARICTANEWFDALDCGSSREQDYALISTCIVDSKGKKVYEPDEVGAMPVTIYSRLYEMVLEVNRPEEAEKK